MWLILAFTSAALLGLYDVFKKTSLTNNAVIPVLFFNILFCCLFLSPVIIFSYFFPEIVKDSLLFLPPIDISQHGWLFLKAIIVLSSWIFAYFSLKHLPITIASPIKATQPVLTLAGAMVIFGERLNIWQWAGILLAIISFYLLSRSGKKEGIHFARNKWIYFMILAVMTGSLSGLYDKFLMSNFDRMNVQVWSTYYQLLLISIILFVMWYPQRKHTTSFRWTYTIPLISLFLVSADFAYFYSLSYEDSMISIVSLVRRSGVVVSFIAGALLFREKNLKIKFIDLILVVTGMYLIYIGTK